MESQQNQMLIITTEQLGHGTRTTHCRYEGGVDCTCRVILEQRGKEEEDVALLHQEALLDQPVRSGQAAWCDTPSTATNSAAQCRHRLCQ